MNLPALVESSFVSQALSLSDSGPDLRFSSVTTDSRKAGPGALFVAIPGDTHDGHDFISKAIEQGAEGVLCRESYAWPTGARARRFAVPDSLGTVEAYRRLGAAWRKRFDIPVLAIAGSEGKTTTKELLAAVLRGRYPSVLKTSGSQNGFVGIPMTLLELKAEHGAAVVEVGIDEIGAMGQHMRCVAAGYATLTSIGPEHLEKLKDVPTVAHEEGLALDAVASTGGTVGICLDDPWISPALERLRGHKLVPYSLCDDSRAELKGVLSPDGLSLDVTAARWPTFRLQPPLLGRHNAMNLLSALSLAYALGFTPEEVRTGLATFEGAEGRSQVRELPGPISVVCDYYNANPTSMAAGFDLLSVVAARLGPGARKIACLADMRELGPNEEKFHRQLAPAILTRGIETVYLLGPKMKWLKDQLERDGFAGELRHFDERAALAAALSPALRPHDAVLLKGSNSMKMQDVWKEISKK